MIKVKGQGHKSVLSQWSRSLFSQYYPLRGLLALMIHSQKTTTLKQLHYLHNWKLILKDLWVLGCIAICQSLTIDNIVEPVRWEYWWKTLRGLDPSITNISTMPLSENQCVSTCGVSPADLKNDISMLACWGEEMIQKPCNTRCNLFRVGTEKSKFFR